MIHKRKGVTLAEMSIVMAVIAIVSLSVVSFVMITSGRGTAGIAKLNAMEEIELVEAVVDGWFAAMPANEVNSVQVSGDKNRVEGVDSGFVTIEIGRDSSTMEVKFPGRDNTYYHFEKIKGLLFDREVSQSGDDVLYFCTVTYVQEEDAREQTYIFCINPRVGETIVPEPTGATTEQEAQQ